LPDSGGSWLDGFSDHLPLPSACRTLIKPSCMPEDITRNTCGALLFVWDASIAYA
jgi:hypothetical protein